jgi:hypothetical protein
VIGSSTFHRLHWIVSHYSICWTSHKGNILMCAVSGTENYYGVTLVHRLRQRSQYSNSLQARQSETKSLWGWYFLHLSRLALGPTPASCTIGTRSLSLALGGQGVTLTTHLHLEPRLKKEHIYTSTPSLDLQWPVLGQTFLLYFTLLYFTLPLSTGRTACSEVPYSAHFFTLTVMFFFWNVYSSDPIPLCLFPI